MSNDTDKPGDERVGRFLDALAGRPAYLPPLKPVSDSKPASDPKPGSLAAALRAAEQPENLGVSAFELGRRAAQEGRGPDPALWAIVTAAAAAQEERKRARILPSPKARAIRATNPKVVAMRVQERRRQQQAFAAMLQLPGTLEATNQLLGAMDKRDRENEAREARGERRERIMIGLGALAVAPYIVGWAADLARLIF